MNDNYWEEFYRKGHTLEPTYFVKFVKRFLKDKKIVNIIDVGCGNGRDTYFLAKNKGYFVIGIDKNYLPKVNRNNIYFIKDDVNNILTTLAHADLIYARFLVHSIDDKTLKNILRFHNFIAVELRSDKDDKKKWVYKGHKRILRSGSELIKIFLGNGYELLYFVESDGLARYKDEDPIVIRLIAKKCPKKK